MHDLSPDARIAFSDATAGRWLITSTGVEPARHRGWIPQLPDHRVDPIEWVNQNVTAWLAVAIPAQQSGHPERAQPMIPRGAVSLAFGAVGASLIARLLVEALAVQAGRIGFPLQPVAAMGSSFFRGGLRPDTAARLLRNCPGLGGMITDEAFRDASEPEPFHEAVQVMQTAFSAVHDPHPMSPRQRKELEELARHFVTGWCGTLQILLYAAKAAARYVPHDLPGMGVWGDLDISLLDGSTRLVDKGTDTMAMVFSAALHTMGLPPGFVGTGRGLADITGTETERLLLEVLPGMPECLALTLRLVNREVLEEAAEAWKGWAEIEEDYHAGAAWVHRHGVDLNEDAVAMTHRRASRQAALAILNRRDPGKHLRVAAEIRRYLG
jgi:phosphoenolpyruvate carboxylase